MEREGIFTRQPRLQPLLLRGNEDVRSARSTNSQHLPENRSSRRQRTLFPGPVRALIIAESGAIPDAQILAVQKRALQICCSAPWSREGKPVRPFHHPRAEVPATAHFAGTRDPGPQQETRRPASSTPRRRGLLDARKGSGPGRASTASTRQRQTTQPGHEERRQHGMTEIPMCAARIEVSTTEFQPLITLVTFMLFLLALGGI